MAVINNEFDAYLENTAKADGFVETVKPEWRRPNYFIDEEACLTKEKRTKKCRAEKKEAEKHCWINWKANTVWDTKGLEILITTL